MKTIHALSILCLISVSANAQNMSLDWAKQIGGSSNVVSSDIAVDGWGNVYTIGHFSGTADFDPGVDTFNLISAGNDDVYITKLDGSGNFVWAKRIGGASVDRGVSIAVDDMGHIYVVGTFNGTADFDPGTDTFHLTGSSDVFIVKLDSSGDFIWARHWGNHLNDEVFSMTLDASGNIYTTGFFWNTVDFDPGSGSFNLSSNGTNDVYISKLDSSGNFLWAKNQGGILDDFGYSIDVDEMGNVYATGFFYGTADFDPGPGSYNLTSAGNEDVFITKLNASGDFQWAKQLGGDSTDLSFSLSVNAGHVYTSGLFWGTADFDPGSDTFNLTSVGPNDIFISCLDTSGSFLWAKQLGGTGDGLSATICSDASGNIYATGGFKGTVDFDPGIDSFNLTAVGDRDIHILKLNASGEFLWAKQMGGADLDAGHSIAVGASENIYTTGVFNGTADFDPGQETFNLTSAGGSDVFVHKLKKCDNHSAISPSACFCYTSPSGNYIWTSSGTYMDTIFNTAGCDSMITIDLSINQSTTGTDVITACDSYTWIDGNTYTASNSTATHTLANATGCDSVVMLNLSINTVDTSVIQTGTTLSSNATAGVTYYQWVDCDNGFAALTGETLQDYAATADGNYAVVVFQNGCEDTSACYRVEVVGVQHTAISSDIRLFPNPTSGTVYIESSAVDKEVIVTVRNALGQIVLDEILILSEHNSLNIEGNKGFYLVELHTRYGHAKYSKVFKQ